MASKKKLTKNELLFCYTYIANKFNGTQAYLKVFNTKNNDTARNNSARLLAKACVKRRIKKLIGNKLKKVAVTAENVVDELRKLAFQDGVDFSDFDGENMDFKSFKEMGEKTACIKEIETTTRFVPSVDEEGNKSMEREQKIKMKMHDKKGSLELLGKHLQLFNDKDPQTPNVNINIDAKDIQSKSAADIARYYNELLKSSTKGK